MSTSIVLSPRVAEKLKTIADAKGCRTNSLADEVIESYCQPERNKAPTLNSAFKKYQFKLPITKIRSYISLDHS